MKPNPVIHFELPGEDKARMSKFYEGAFGWKTQMLGKEMGEYVVATTTEVDPKTNRPKEPGAINGGFYSKPAVDPMGQHPGVVIATENLEESIKWVQDAGGKIHGDIQDIPGVGRFVSIIDTEGNRVSVLQPIGM
jgi:predicted enzyme related to lactoylglutathione lyase